MLDRDAGKAVVLYDGQCAFCQKSVNLLKPLDWLGRLVFRDGRDSANWPPCPEPLTLDNLLHEMHVVTPNRQQVYRGFYGFRWIAGRIPPLWLMWPLLFVPGIPMLGRWVYLWIAKHRYELVPCHDGQCAIPQRSSPSTRSAARRG